jgi:hypothetical protein
MKNGQGMLAALALIFASGLLTNCSMLCKRSTNLQIVPGLETPVPYVMKGDVLKWFDSQGKPLPVTFIGGKPPCKGGANNVAVCQVDVDQGIFPYMCKGCEDPVVPVGKSTRIYPDTRIAQGAFTSTAVPDPVPVFCDGANAAVYSPVVGKSPQYFAWIASGQNPPTKWKITFTSDACVEGREFGTYSGKYRCTISAAVTAPVTYSVHVDDCTGTKDTTGQITPPAGGFPAQP